MVCLLHSATAAGYGRGDPTCQLQPKRVEVLADKRGLLDVATDSSHLLALTAKDALFSSGLGGYGPLGHGGVAHLL